MKSPLKFWTPDKVEILKIQWKAGTSARAIAAMLGGGRNAVIGKANRLGLPPHAGSRCRLDAAEKRARKKRATKTLNLPRNMSGRRARARVTPQGSPLPPPPPAPGRVEARRIRFAELAHFHCLYPVTEEPPFLFCGYVRQEKSAYCALHHALCHVKARYDEARRTKQRPRSRFDFVFARARAA